MYGALWRVLPGPWPVRLLLCLLLVAAVVYALFEFVFPAVEHMIPWNRNTVGEGG